MSDAPPAAWQRAEIAEEFLEHRQGLLPMLDVQEELVGLLFERAGRPVARFLDLGSGDGAMTQLIRSAAPHAEAVLVDFSETMLARAERRLGRGTGAWRGVSADLSTPAWREALPDGPFDAVVSSYAIHHLTSERKRALYAEINELLAPGGMFVNMDVVKISGPLEGLFDERIAAAHAGLVGAHAGEHGEYGADTFEDSAEDRPDPLEDQLAWLGEAGFEQVEVHFKWAEGAIFGAIKPERRA